MICHMVIILRAYQKVLIQETRLSSYTDSDSGVYNGFDAGAKTLHVIVRSYDALERPFRLPIRSYCNDNPRMEIGQ